MTLCRTALAVAVVVPLGVTMLAERTARAAPQAPSPGGPGRPSAPVSPATAAAVDRAVNDVIHENMLDPSNMLDLQIYGNARLREGKIIWEDEAGNEIEVVTGPPEATHLPDNSNADTSHFIGSGSSEEATLAALGNLELPHLTAPAYADTATSTDDFASLQFLQIYGNSSLSTYQGPSSAGISQSSAGHSLSAAGHSLSAVGHSLSAAGNSLSSAGHSLSSAGLEGYDPNTGQYFPPPNVPLSNPDGNAPAQGGGAVLCGR